MKVIQMIKYILGFISGVIVMAIFKGGDRDDS